MALGIFDRVRESTSVTGTGTATLLGAATGYQSFAVVGNGNTTYYCIAGQGTAEWEVGIGTYTASGTTLARTTVISSSNANALVSFSAGSKDVFVTYPGTKGVYLDASGNAIGLGTPAAFTGTNITGTASSLSIGGNAATATNVAYSGLTGTVPTWNQNTTGSSASCTGNSATVTNGVYTTGSYANPTWITNINYSILNGTVPTWNQNTTGSSGSCTGNAATATTATNLSGGSVNATSGTFSGLITTDSYYKLTNSGTQVGLIAKYKSIAGSGTDNTPTYFSETGLGLYFCPNGLATVAASLSTTGVFTATSFTGAGTGLTGTASSFSIGGNAATATNASQLNSLTKVQMWNNSGQNHSTYQSFGAIPDFGVWFMQNSAAGDVPQSGQFYTNSVGLGNDYDYSQYAMQTAVLRNTTNPYQWIRYKEATSWGAWTKTAAGYADTAGSSASCTGNAATATTASALSATSWQNITGNAPTGSSYGSIAVSGATGGYGGVYYSTQGSTFMVGANGGATGMYQNGTSSWQWYWQNVSGGESTLTAGLVPYGRLSGTVPTWNQNTTGSSASCTGNAATATTATSASNLTGGTMSGTITLTDAGYFRGAPTQGYRFNNNADTFNNVIFSDNGNVTIRGSVSATNITSGGNVTGSSTSCTGNAATATALSTAGGSAPSYGARAWVNFNGQGTVAIYASGNISSITDNGVGKYRLNFTTAMQDVNYTFSGGIVHVPGVSYGLVCALNTTILTTSIELNTFAQTSAIYDPPLVTAIILR